MFLVRRGLGLERVHCAYQMGNGRIRQEMNEEKLEKGKVGESISFSSPKLEYQIATPQLRGSGLLCICMGSFLWYLSLQLKGDFEIANFLRRLVIFFGLLCLRLDSK